MRLLNLIKAHKALSDRRISRIATVSEFLRYNPDSTVQEISDALHINKKTCADYTDTLRIDGLAHVSGSQSSGNCGARKACWSYGPEGHPETWAHGSATRYEMGRAV